METKIKFFKLKNGVFKWSEYHDLVLRTCLNLDWTKADYAKKFTWVTDKEFYDDVETPTKDVTIDEFQTDEGQKKQWNKMLKELVETYENNELLEECLEFEGNVLVVNVNGVDMFITRENGDFFDDEDLVDVTEEYMKYIVDNLKPKEIEEYCKIHTPDEIEKKYAVKGFEIGWFWTW